MTADRIRQLEELFDRARTVPTNNRAVFVRSACVADAEMERELLSLLAADERADAPLDRPALGAALPHAAFSAAAILPQRVGRYRILRLIGEGGMGLVFEAEQENPRRRVALKLLRPGLATAATLRRFEQEAQLLGRLRHPGIAQVYEAGTAEIDIDGVAVSQPFLALELVEGKTITDFAAQQQLSPRERIALAADVCDAVHHAHQRGVIHRDLKPGNILVSHEATETRSAGAEDAVRQAGHSVAPWLRGAVATPKILDFGIARVIDDELCVATMHTAPGQIVGTLPYMSPEQIAGDPADLDVRTDVYSLGIVAYELLTGRTPHGGHSVAELVQRIATVEPPRMSTLNGALRGDVETIILKAIDKDRTRRYASMAHFGQDLRRFLANEPIEARRSTSAYILRKLVARHPLATLGMLAFLLTVVGSAIALGSLYRDQLVQRQRADEEARRAVASSERAERYAADAREKFHLARGAVEYLMDEVASRLRRLLGTNQIRKDLLREAYARLAPLVEDAGDDPELQYQVARLHGKLGKAALEFGDTTAGLEQFATARDLFDRLTVAHPEQVRYWQSLAEVYGNLSDIAWRAGDAEGMVDPSARQLEICERLIAVEPENPVCIRSLSLAYERLAIRASEQRQAAEHLEWSRRMHTLKARLVELNPDDPLALYELSVAEERLGECARESQDIDRAEQHTHAARALRECLLVNEPNNPTYLRALSINFERLAMFAAARDDRTADRDWTQRMHELKVRLATLEPGNPIYQHDLAICCERLARQAARVGDQVRARRLLQQSQAIYERLVQAEPGIRRYREDLKYNAEQLARLAEVGDAADQ